MRRVALILLAGLLAGCTNMLAVRQAQLNPLIGRTEGELVQQVGVPNRVYETGGIKYLAYVEGGIEVIPALPAYPYGSPYWGGWYGGSNFPPQVVNTVCETTFAVVKGIVASYTLRGNACG
jgi:hypothetical protein